MVATLLGRLRQGVQKPARRDHLGADIRYGRAVEPKMQGVDEHRRRDRRQAVGDQHDNDRRARALYSAHPPVAGENDERARNSDHRDSEPPKSGVLDGARCLPPEALRQWTAEPLAYDDDDAKPSRTRAIQVALHALR